MSNVWVTSDWHINHRNILDYCHRPWKTLDEMHSGLIANYNKKVNPGDNVYFLGDIIFGKKKLLPDIMNEVFSQLNGQKFLIKGNHDYYCKEEWFSKHFVWIRDYYELRVLDAEAPNGKWQKFIMCHYPIYSWNEMANGSICLSGHAHGSTDQTNLQTRRIDVGIDAMYSDHSPINVNTILGIMKNRKSAIVDHHGMNL